LGEQQDAEREHREAFFWPGWIELALLVVLAVVKVHVVDPVNLSGPDGECSNFAPQAQAQPFFRSQGPGSVLRLDAEGNGCACEARR
jgi:hypothetical protein